MYDFTYHRPDTLDKARSLLGQSDDGKLLAGGQTLLPTMKQRLAGPSDVIDLGGIAELSGITQADGLVTIGAGTCHAEVAASAVVRAAIPALADLVQQIGDPQVRNVGTIGGSIANNDPAADYPAAVLGLGATVVTTTREIAADDFFLDMFETALADDEIITAVRFPVPQAAAYQRFMQPASRFALVGVMVARTGGGVRVAVTGAGPCVFRVGAMETALTGNFSAESLAEISVPAAGLNSDIHGSAEYRAHLVGVMARRAVQAAG